MREYAEIGEERTVIEMQGKLHRTPRGKRNVAIHASVHGIGKLKEQQLPQSSPNFISGHLNSHSSKTILPTIFFRKKEFKRRNEL